MCCSKARQQSLSTVENDIHSKLCTKGTVASRLICLLQWNKGIHEQLVDMHHLLQPTPCTFWVG